MRRILRDRSRPWLAALVLGTLCTLLGTPEARAALIIINTTSDAPSPAACRLRAAIIAANTNAPYEGCNAGSGSIDLIGFRDIAGQVIVLNGTRLPDITTDIQFIGDDVQINANGQSGIFWIEGATVFMPEMTLASASDGVWPYAVVVIGSEARLQLNRVSIEGNDNGILSLESELLVNDSQVIANGRGITSVAGSLNIVRSRIVNNVEGVRILGVSPTIADSTFSGNDVGIYARESVTSMTGPVTVRNVTISGSVSYGIEIGEDFEAEMSLDQVTIIDSGVNGIRKSVGLGTINLSNSIIYDSGVADCFVVMNIVPSAFTVHVLGINLVERLSVPIANPFDENCIWAGPGAVVEGVAPLLGPLQDNGGPTLTHLPLPGSPVIDSGDNAVVVSDDDQRGPGFDRIANGGTVDLGAVEVQSAVQAGPDFVVNTAEDSRDGACDPTPADCSLFEAMEASNVDPGPSRINFSVKLATDPATVLDISGGPLPPITTPVTITGQGLSVDTVGAPLIIDPSGGSLGLEWLGIFTD